MSRIGRQPIEIPKGVKVELKNSLFTARGPKGEQTVRIHPDMSVQIKENEITVKRPSDNKLHRSLHGTTRQIIYNAVYGVSEGFSKKLVISGTAYKASMKGKNLELQVGFSHPVIFEPFSGVEFKVEGNVITVFGSDKYLVGETAAKIRRVRPTDPYKGKGIRYIDEHVRRKAGKAGAKA